MKPLRILWLVPALAVSVAGCIMSERPLTPPRSGTLDTRLVGAWAEQGNPDAGVVLRIRQLDADTLEFRSIERDGSYVLLTGHTSLIDGATYANLRLRDAGCDDCSDDELARVRERFRRDFGAITASNPIASCTWMIAHYVLGDDGTLWYAGIDPKAAQALIDAGELRGETREAEPKAEGDDYQCITESRRGLQNFVSDHGEIFSDEAPLLVRQ